VYDVCFKILGYNFEAVKIGWIFFNTVGLMVLLDNLLLYPSPPAIYLLFICFMIVYAMAFVWGTYSVYTSYAGSTGTVTSNSNHVNSPKRIILRLACLVLITLSSLLTYITTLSLDYFDVFRG